MTVGVDYYPEHWSEELWRSDIELMEKTGVKLARIGEFAWSRLEPREGEFDFSLLDKAIELFSSHGIGVILCTPTSCPPLWLYEKYPQAVRVGTDGRRIAAGIRGHRCVNSPELLKFSDRIVKLLAERYCGNKAVKLWQIDNELEADICFCENCSVKFVNRLKEKYGTLENINRAYGNSVWSGEYSAWEQIFKPFGSYPQAWLNPALMLDVRRFFSDSIIGFLSRQADIIRSVDKNAKITTNTWFCEYMPDFYKEFENIDVVSYDNYPPLTIPSDAEAEYSHALQLDIMRGIKKKNFMIMEQLSGAMGCWMPMTRTPKPGMIEGYALQAFAHGADSVVHFRWRTALTGAEMHWHGLIDHSNAPGRRFGEFEELCKKAKTLEALKGSKIISKAAVIYSPEAEYAFKIQPQTDGFYYFEQLKKLYGALKGFGINIDVVNYGEPLDGYTLAAAPTLYVNNEKGVAEIERFVSNGGTLVLTNRSGVKDEHNNCIMQPLPTVFAEMAGVTVEEYDPLGYAEEKIIFENKEYKALRWCDVLSPLTAEPAAVYSSGFYAGKCAVSENNYNGGRVFYIGTVGEKSFYRALFKYILDKTGIGYIPDLPDGVEMTVRTGESVSAEFVFNNTDTPKSFALRGEELSLQPFEMQVRYFEQ